MNHMHACHMHRAPSPAEPRGRPRPLLQHDTPTAACVAPAAATAQPRAWPWCGCMCCRGGRRREHQIGSIIRSVRAIIRWGQRRRVVIRTGSTPAVPQACTLRCATLRPGSARQSLGNHSINLSIDASMCQSMHRSINQWLRCRPHAAGGPPWGAPRRRCTPGYASCRCSPRRSTPGSAGRRRGRPRCPPARCRARSRR